MSSKPSSRARSVLPSSIPAIRGSLIVSRKNSINTW
ncbi:Uncharacterised protein [Vibrio cholerae]|nr:Uncharacterised protein [Vibrio cholerae]